MGLEIHGNGGVTTVENLQQDNYTVYFQCSDCQLIFTDDASHSKHVCSAKLVPIKILGDPVTLTPDKYKSIKSESVVRAPVNKLALLQQAALEIGDGDISPTPPPEENVKNNDDGDINLASSIEKSGKKKTTMNKTEDEEKLESAKKGTMKFKSVLIYVCSKCEVAFKEPTIFKKHSCVKEKLLKEKNKRLASVDKDESAINKGIDLSVQYTHCQVTLENITAFNTHPCILEKEDRVDESNPENVEEKTGESISAIKVEPDLCLELVSSAEMIENSTIITPNKQDKYINDVSISQMSLKEEEYVDDPSTNEASIKQSEDDPSMSKTSSQKPRRKKNQTPTPWQCSVCHKYFQTRYYLVHHSCEPPSKNPLPNGALGKPPYICPKCGNSYKHKQSFCRHIHHECKMNKRPEKIIPPIRPRNSASKNTPTKSSISSKVKPFKCPVCDKCFARKYYLTHHSCDPPYANPLPRGALGKPPYLCSGCGVIYKHKQSYCRHIHHECGRGRTFYKNSNGKYVGKGRKKKASETYLCSLCNTDFRDQDALEAHVQVDHLTL